MPLALRSRAPDAVRSGTVATDRARSAVALVTIATALLLVGGCADDGPDELAVEMYDDFFEPEEVRVEPGQPVRFVNVGQVPHNAIDLGGAWTTEHVIDTGDDEVVTIDEPGVYDYYCSFHATGEGVGMAGTIVVGDEAEADAAADARDQVTEWTGQTRRVPEDHPTIQSAVDAAEPGDLVLIGPGTYREQVEVTTPSITVRGRDRNEVVIDAEQVREMGIIATADGVAVENLTVRNAISNGIYWRGVTGYRGSYLTAIGNVKYGIYAFDSTDGLFEHSYASGSADAGYYIGQCRPCHAVVTDVVAEHNGLGYSGTNAGGELYLVNSTWQHNGAGIVPNTLDSQRDPPARHPTIIGNVVRDNGVESVPFLGGTWPAFGNGIVLAGVRDAVVERNLVIDNPYHGIITVPNLDRNFWPTGENTVRDNVVRGSGRADLTFSAPATGGDCWEGNDAGRTAPWALQGSRSCGRTRIPRLAFGPTFTFIGHVASRPEIDIEGRAASQPEPGDLEQMPGGAEADVRPAHDVFASVDLDPDAIDVPAWDGSQSDDQVTLLMGVPIFAGTAWEIWMGLLGTLIPIVLYVAWVGVALWDLARQPDRSLVARGVWAVAIVLLPLIGVLAYHVAGRPRLSWTRRLALVGGGLVGWLGLVVVSVLSSGLL